MDKQNPFKTISSHIAYSNPWMRVREDKIIRPSGDEGMYGVIETNDSVSIVAVNDNEEICLIRTFRYPAQKWCWELPIGGCDKQEPEIAGQRELLEETGITAKSWTRLGNTRVCVGLMVERKTTFLATGLVTGDATDDDEGIEKVAFKSLADIDAMIAAGDIDDDQTLSSLYLYRQHRT